jgi:dTDP-4-dehydrorhamnose 3,5-epimerase
MDDSQIFIVGAKGQLGLALQAQYPGAQSADIDEMDITDAESVNVFDWSGIKVILNAAAFTNVDGAETKEGESAAWAVNDKAVENLVQVAEEHDMTLVHISTAYVFDGEKEIYTEADEVNPLGIYARSKAAGDERIAKCAKHYIVRTDSVIGDGKNFVRTMLGLASQGINPSVVADQIIRPTFTSVLVQAIKFLLDHQAPFGTYNVTNEGETVSWANFTRAIFEEAKVNATVSDTTLEAYASSRPGIAPRPLHSVLDLSKIESLGFTPNDWHDDLKAYLEREHA